MQCSPMREPRCWENGQWLSAGNDVRFNKPLYNSCNLRTELGNRILYIQFFNFINSCSTQSTVLKLYSGNSMFRDLTLITFDPAQGIFNHCLMSEERVRVETRICARLSSQIWACRKHHHLVVKAIKVHGRMHAVSAFSHFWLYSALCLSDFVLQSEFSLNFMVIVQSTGAIQ